MGVGLVMLGASMPLLVLPSSLAGVGAALCFMGVSCALAVTGTLPQVPLALQPPSHFHPNNHALPCSSPRKWSAWAQLTAASAYRWTPCTPCSTPRECKPAPRRVYSLALGRYALGSIMGPTLGLWMVQGMGMQATYTLFGAGIAAFR